MNSVVPPPPGFERRSTSAYPYNTSNPRKKRQVRLNLLLQLCAWNGDNFQDYSAINKRKPPISIDRLGHPNFKPIARSGSSFSGSSLSPMDMSYDQTQIGRAISSKHNSPQDHLAARQGACALSPYSRSLASGSSEFSDSDGKVFYFHRFHRLNLSVFSYLLGLYIKWNQHKYSGYPTNRFNYN